MPRAKQRLELVQIPVPKNHRPRPDAQVTGEDRRIIRDYLACKGDVASVRDAHGLSQTGLLYALVKLGVWKRWSPVPKAVRRCAHCLRPLRTSARAYHSDCRWKVRAADSARILKRARNLLASGLTVVATAAKVGRSPNYLSALLPGAALSNEQLRRRGLPPREVKPRTAARSTGKRAAAQRAADWVLVPVPVPPTFRGRPPERLDARERRAVKGYLDCGGDVARVARSADRSAAWLGSVLRRARIWQRWKRRPARRPCVVCGRPLPTVARGTRHMACLRKQVAGRRKAWIARARKLLAKGWTLQRVADRVGINRSKVTAALPGHARGKDARLATLDARLRRFARHVKAGLSRREAGRRVGYAANTVHKAAARARRKGYL